MLEREKLIEQVPAPAAEPQDERRQYYALTRSGRVRLREEAEMLARWAEAAQDRQPS
jgi:DNA-binding PadR family transcriptional regulator